MHHIILLVSIITCITAQVATTVATTVMNTIKITSIINQERKHYNQPGGINSTPFITYNQSLHDDLIKFNHTGQWYYSRSLTHSRHIPMLNRTWNENSMFLMDEPYFKNYYRDGWRFAFRDTYQTSVSIIIKYRANQRNCFMWSLCDKSHFNDYITCLSNIPPLINGSVPYSYTRSRCAWAWAYYPHFIDKDLQQIACIQLDYRTQYVPIGLNQPYSFLCMARYNRNDSYPSSDIML
jgi:hypothetical protein